MPNPNQVALRQLVDLRNRTLQKGRIAFTLRGYAVEEGQDSMTDQQKKMISNWEERFQGMEDMADDEIKELVKDMPIVQEMVKVKGVGLLLAAQVVSMIDIERANSVSALWRYAGYGLIEKFDDSGASLGKSREAPTKGEKLHYNKRLKVTCYLVATSFLRCNSPYRLIYDQAKEYYDQARPEWSKAHKHLAAMRKMTKIWLAAVWLYWRTLEGLPVREPYVQEKLAHEHIFKPEDFGWGPLPTGNDLTQEKG
jgi:hypothetical protein